MFPKSHLDCFIIELEIEAIFIVLNAWEDVEAWIPREQAPLFATTEYLKIMEKAVIRAETFTRVKAIWLVSGVLEGHYFLQLLVKALHYVCKPVDTRAATCAGTSCRAPE